MEKKLTYFFIFLIIAFFCPKVICAKEILVIDANTDLKIASEIKAYHFTKDLSYFDFKQNLNSLKSNFKIENKNINWITFNLRNNSFKDHIFFLSTNFSDSLELYDITNNSLVGITGNGYQYSRISRPTESGYIKFSIEPQITKKFAIKLKGAYPKDTVVLKIQNGNNITNIDDNNYIWNVCIYAVIASFIIFNFLVFIILRDKTYIYYLFYLTSLLIFLSIRVLTLKFNLPFDTYTVDYIFIDTFLILFNISAINFTLSYFRTESNSKWNKIFNFYKFLFVIPILLGVYYYRDYYQEPQNISLAILSLFTIILMLIFSLSNYLKNNKSTLLFLLAESPIIIAGAIVCIEFCFTSNSLSERIGPNLVKISVILEILLFSFALGNRYREQRVLWLEQIEENNQLKTQRLLDIQNLTEQKNKELEQLVLLRTTELKESNLKLIKSHDEKNKLFSILGHDLKSPLSSLQMMLDLFITKDLNEVEFKELALGVKQKLKGLNEAIQNLFLWAQTQMKGETINTTIFNIKTLIDEKIDFLKISLENKEINLELIIANNLEAFADSNQIGIVLQNLINNAIKFTNIGGMIKISATKESQYINVNIIDNGKGMSPELVERIQKYELVGSSKGTLGEIGTGLGLIICKEMLHKNNGTLKIVSELGKGTTISFLIPAN